VHALVIPRVPLQPQVREALPEARPRAPRHERRPRRDLGGIPSTRQNRRLVVRRPRQPHHARYTGSWWSPTRMAATCRAYAFFRTIHQSAERRGSINNLGQSRVPDQIGVPEAYVRSTSAKRILGRPRPLGSSSSTHPVTTAGSGTSHYDTAIMMTLLCLRRGVPARSEVFKSLESRPWPLAFPLPLSSPDGSNEWCRHWRRTRQPSEDVPRTTTWRCSTSVL
jgi:hypothetical protein